MKEPKTWWLSGAGVTHTIDGGHEQIVQMAFSKVESTTITGDHTWVVEKSAYDELKIENLKLRTALLNIAHDTSDNRDFFLQHTAQDALEI